MADIRLGVDASGLREVSRQLRRLEDGKELRKELAAELRGAVQPAVAEARGAIMSMPARGTVSPALRSAIAKRVLPEVHTTGRWTGVRVRAAQTPEIRGFRNAARRTQSRDGWRHPTFGRRGKGDWVKQRGKPDWFDRSIAKHRAAYETAVREALDRWARKLADRVDGSGGK